MPGYRAPFQPPTLLSGTGHLVRQENQHMHPGGARQIGVELRLICYNCLSDAMVAMPRGGSLVWARKRASRPRCWKVARRCVLLVYRRSLCRCCSYKHSRVDVRRRAKTVHSRILSFSSVNALFLFYTWHTSHGGSDGGVWRSPLRVRPVYDKLVTSFLAQQTCTRHFPSPTC